MPRPRPRAKTAGALLGDVETRRLVFVDGAFVPELSDLAGLERGLSVGSLADALAGSDPALLAHLGKLAPAGDVAVALNTALMGDGAVIRIGDGRDHRAAAASCLRRLAEARGDVRALAGGRGARRPRHADREP